MGSLDIQGGAAGAGKEGEKQREGRAADARGRVGVVRGGEGGSAAPKRNADCFHVWGGQENGAGCSQVRLALMRKVALAMKEAQDRTGQKQSAAKERNQLTAAHTHGGAQRRRGDTAAAEAICHSLDLL